MIQDFMCAFEESVRKYDCWRCAGHDEIDESSEALEYLISKAKGEVLMSLLVEEKERDETIMQKYEEYDFIEPRHLEIPME